jgi:hypothetical protein
MTKSPRVTQSMIDALGFITVRRTYRLALLDGRVHRAEGKDIRNWVTSSISHATVRALLAVGLIKFVGGNHGATLYEVTNTGRLVYSAVNTVRGY